LQHSRRWQLSIAFVCMFLGVVLAVQFRTQVLFENQVVNQREEDLVTSLKQSEESRKSLEDELAKLKKLVEDETTGADVILQEEMVVTRIAAGIIPAEGEGIIITMRDSNRPVQSGDDPNAYLIHDTDLLKVVNELKASGAECISVNEQRITAMSEIRCAGPTILVNRVRLAPPYIIKATGDGETLTNGLKMPGGIVETLQYWGIMVEIKKSQKILIPAFKGSFEYKHTTAPKGDVN